MHKATLYKKISGKKIKCTACAHYCHIAPDKTGVCGIRKNVDGQLYLLVYGKPIAVNIDPIEKKPLFHFLPKSEIFSIGTVGCNFACDFCQNWDISQTTKNNPDFNWEETKPTWSPELIVEYCLRHNIPSIAYTYNEPTVFIEYAYDTARLARDKGIKNIFVSNGYGSKEAYNLIGPYLDAINIDLKSFDPEYYRRVCSANLKPVLKNIQLLHGMGIWVEVTTLIVPGQNDSPNELQQIAEYIASIDPDIPWHISRFFPHHKMSNTPPTPIETLRQAHKIGLDAGLNYVYVGNCPSFNLESTYCPKCKKNIVEREGYQIDKINIEYGKCKFCGEKIKGVWG